MVGRGRGKPAISFSMEQLGISKEEALSTPVVQPTPTYPSSEQLKKLAQTKFELTHEMKYLIGLKRHFIEYMRESPNYVQATVLNEDIERYCEDFDEAIIANDESKFEAYHDWSRMPAELKVSRKRKSQQQNTKGSKKEKDVDIVNKLVELEKGESTQQSTEEEDEEDNEEKEMGEYKEEEEEEDEMDEGTDYVNEYFENGDNYYSEDDNDDAQFFDS